MQCTCDINNEIKCKLYKTFNNLQTFGDKFQIISWNIKMWDNNHRI